jgi:hypothetical protein
MDRPIHTAAAGQRRIGGVHYGIYGYLGNVALMEYDFSSARAYPFHGSITIVL